jgi:ribosomal protein S18 acetylase RimI-like enzyme
LGKKKIVSFENPFHRCHSPAAICAAEDEQKNEQFGTTVTLGSAAALRNHLAMGDAAISVRLAKPDDAEGIARVYIESWHDTYAAILPMRLLCAMTPRGQTSRWRQAIRARGEAVFVAQDERLGIVGMASCGRSRDRALPFDGEIYTLYVDPALYGCGIGRSLLSGAFGWMTEREYESCVIWAHAKNNARFFYEKMGGRLVAERAARMMGDPVPEAAFGWRRLALAEGASSR